MVPVFRDTVDYCHKHDPEKSGHEPGLGIIDGILASYKSSQNADWSDLLIARIKTVRTRL